MTNRDGAAAPGKKFEGCAENPSQDHVRSFAGIRGSAAEPDEDDRIVICDPTRDPGWNTAVCAKPGHSIFHSAEWAEVLLKTYRWRAFYLQAGTALLPLIEASSWATRARGVSLPFTDFCPALTEDGRDARQLFQAALDLGRRRGWKYIEFRGGIRKLSPEAKYSDQFYGHELDLRPGKDKLFEHFESSVRRAIRKAQASGVEVELTSNMGAVEEFWKLHLQTRQRHGVPPQPFGFLRAIHDQLLSKGKGFVSVARHHGRAVAACVFLHFNRTALYKFGASDRSSSQLRGMNAAFWKAIEHYAQNGYELLHLGRTDLSNDGLRRFKLGWGAREDLLGYCRYDLRQSAFVAAGLPASRGVTAKIFRKMPIPVLRFVGAALYKHAA